jgi:hypothetical protein
MEFSVKILISLNLLGFYGIFIDFGGLAEAYG